MSLPRVVADGPLDDVVTGLLEGKVEVLSWQQCTGSASSPVDGLYTYGHPPVDGSVMDRLRGLKVISNYGVGVDHIRLADAAERGIPVGNTPGILDGATADMAMALLLAAARRLIEGDLYARSAEFTSYDPGYMLGREVHGATIGIIGLGRIGWQIARRARGFDMRIIYHNRHRRQDAEEQLSATYVDLERLLATADYIVLCCPLTDSTRGLIGRAQLERMQSTATLVNIARGPVVDTEALAWALSTEQIHAAAVNVTDPEPLPRDHALLRQKNLVIAPHLGSATVQTRRKMSEISVQNLLAGLQGKPLVHEIRPA